MALFASRFGCHQEGPIPQYQCLGPGQQSDLWLYTLILTPMPILILILKSIVIPTPIICWCYSVPNSASFKRKLKTCSGRVSIFSKPKDIQKLGGRLGAQTKFCLTLKSQFSTISLFCLPLYCRETERQTCMYRVVHLSLNSAPLACYCSELLWLLLWKLTAERVFVTL